jgi:dTDP-glucose 4,6-dehydratase
MDDKLGRLKGESEELITYVTDRKGHDMRYAIDATKIQNELGWKPTITFEQGLEQTVEWYLSHQEWVDEVTSGSYQTYYDNMYKNR